VPHSPRSGILSSPRLQASLYEEPLTVPRPQQVEADPDVGPEKAVPVEARLSRRLQADEDDRFHV
jgi:hypothetical protein